MRRKPGHFTDFTLSSDLIKPATRHSQQPPVGNIRPYSRHTSLINVSRPNNSQTMLNLKSRQLTLNCLDNARGKRKNTSSLQTYRAIL